MDPAVFPIWSMKQPLLGSMLGGAEGACRFILFYFYEKSIFLNYPKQPKNIPFNPHFLYWKTGESGFQYVDLEDQTEKMRLYRVCQLFDVGNVIM